MKHNRLIDLVDTPLDVEDQYSGYGGGTNNFWGLSNSASDVAIRANRQLKIDAKKITSAQKKSGGLTSPSSTSLGGGTNTISLPVNNASAPNNPDPNTTPDDEDDHTILYAGIGSGVIILIIILYFVFKK